MGTNLSLIHKDIEISAATENNDWFTKLENIGSGHFGTVYICKMNDSGEKFALKEINASRLSEKNIKDLSSLIEISICKQLTHRNIIPYYYAKQDKESFNYLVFMKYAWHGSLGKLYRKFGPFNVSNIGKYTRDIIQGLQYLHSLQIAHRDIKCDNVLLDINDVAKLSDFGLAKAMRESVQYFSTQCGTKYFKAPEIVPGKRHTLKADIWSLGATVLEMNLAEAPDQLDDRLSRLAKPLEVYEKQTSKLSKTVLSFTKECLKTDCNERADLDILIKHELCSESNISSDSHNLLLFHYENIDKDPLSSLSAACFTWKIARSKTISKLKLKLKTFELSVEGDTRNAFLLELNEEAEIDIFDLRVLSAAFAYDLMMDLYLGSFHRKANMVTCFQSIMDLMIEDQKNINLFNKILKKTIDQYDGLDLSQIVESNYLKPSRTIFELGELQECDQGKNLIKIFYDELNILYL